MFRKLFASRHPRPITRPFHKLSLEALEDRCLPTAVTYHGGMLLTNVQAEAIYLGPQWQQSGSLQQDAQQLNQFLQYITNSPYMDMLGEYYEVLPLVNQAVHVGRGSFTGSDVANYSLPLISNGLVIDDRPDDPSTGHQNVFEYYLTQEIQSGKVPRPNDWQSLYVIFLPPGVGTYECQHNNWLGYHSNFFLPDSPGSNSGDNVNYAVIPYPGQGNLSIPGLSSAFDGQTAVLSHELAESATDPYKFLFPSGATEGGWFETNAQNVPTEEIGDLAEGYFLRLNNYVVQAVWSASRNEIVGPNGGIWLTTGSASGGPGTGLESNGSPTGPIGQPDNYWVVTNKSLFVSANQGVLIDDADSFKNSLQAVLVSPPSHGQYFTLNSDGSFTYTPAAGYVGNDTFTYEPSDGTFVGNPVTVTIHVDFPSTTVLSVSAANIQAGQSVTLTATVTNATTNWNAQQGEVGFINGSNVLGIVGLVNGKASLNVELPVGTNNIQAQYYGLAGDFGLSPSTSNTVTVNVSSSGADGNVQTPPAPPSLNVPPLLAFFDSLLEGTEMVNADGTETVTDRLFGFPLLVATFDSSGNLQSVTLFGMNVTTLFEMM